MEPPILGAVAFSMLALAAPRIAADHVAGRKDELLALWRRGCRTVALTSVPATAASVAVAPHLFALAFGEPYAKSSEVYVWYAAVLLMRCFLPNVLLESTGATVRGAWSAASQLVFSVLFACLLIPAFGPVGAAAAMCLASFASNWAVGGFFARNALECRWRDLCDWGYLARMVAACAAGIIAARWVLSMPAPMVPVPAVRVTVHAAQIVTGLAVFTAVAGALALPLRIVTRDDLEALRKLVKR
jgi:O-antigen/teichoic acid export membrane protein